MRKLTPAEERKNPNITVNLALETHRRASVVAAHKGESIGPYCDRAVLTQVAKDEKDMLKEMSKPSSK